VFIDHACVHGSERSVQVMCETCHVVVTSYIIEFDELYEFIVNLPGQKSVITGPPNGPVLF